MKVKVCFLTALTELQEYKSFQEEVFPEEGKRYFVQKPIRSEEQRKFLDRPADKIVLTDYLELACRD